jgi:hypothetical protein
MSLFRNMTLRWKLILAFSALVILSGTVAIVAQMINSEERSYADKST